ncbi:ZIP family metal transporter [Haloplanus aerogenes]|uniref:Metal transporter n=1 Tax=Haloplanus aerogenes TaxID=660522 RepID=A0A3M0DSK6_9EURY|nr:metal transporter [Haloplanus aerogenes]AZH25386.1 metal transporter [Haloplanus aerogenes]RMB25089.1 zinc transporter ZupT [Haloplanus aerogenes]
MSQPDGGTTMHRTDRPLGLPRWVAAVLPLVLLALIVGGFFVATPFASLDTGGEPLPDVTVTHTTLTDDETVVLHVTNNGPDPVTISQVLVDDAYWNFDVRGAGGDATLAPLESARVVLPYHWNPGWDLEFALVLSDGATVHHTLVAPSESPGLTTDLLVTMVVIGLFVGVIPVALGMLWFPFLQSMSDRWLHAILAFSAGILVFLAIDAGFEAFELGEQVPGAFEGPALVALGILGSLLAVQSVSAWRQGRADGGDARAQSGLWIAYLVALGIGLHNLAEGLAIGSSFALGRVSLGAFLVIGFMLHNVTEGPAVVAPLAHGERPPLTHFLGLGVLAGAPVILGGWLGSLAYSPTLGALFLAVGVGAILQVVWELRGMIGRRGRAGTALNLVTFLTGLIVMYVTDLFVAL